MNRYMTWTAVWLGAVGVGLWYLFGSTAAAQSRLDETTDQIRQAVDANDESALHKAVAEHIEALQTEVGDDVADLRLFEGLKSLEDLRHRAATDDGVREGDQVERDLSDFGDAVNEDLKTVASRIGNLSQSYEIPPLKINGNGVSGTQHVDREDAGSVRKMPAESGIAAVSGEAPSELDELRAEVQRLSAEVRRLTSLMESSREN